MKIRLEPVGEEFDCAPDETILDAAFRNGLNLVYGCREGQCSACKCFLLEGDAALKRYSNFALSDTEQANGYSLMCRAMPETDLVVELLHYDPDALRLAHPIRDGRAVVEGVEELTHDISGVILSVVEPDDFAFLPGQYVDLHVPGDPSGGRRSFSIANLPGDGRIELMIKRYPGGKLSGMLGAGQLKAGDEMAFTGPYGAFHLRAQSERPILMLAGGSGMAPVLAVLRQLAQDGCERPVRFFYGARTRRDLFGLEEIERLGANLPDFRFEAVLSDGDGGRFVHEAVDAFLESEAAYEQPDVYMCGPPPMIEAAEDMLAARGVEEQRIFMDKFTTSTGGTGASGASADTGESPGGQVKRFSDGATVNGAQVPESERQFGWFTPAGRRATLYEDVTVDTQPSVYRHLARGWPVSFEDGRGTWNDGSTALRSTDWFAFRDPGEQWERPYYQEGSATENAIEGALRSASAEGLLDDYSPAWVEFLRGNLQVPAFYEHGLWFATATVARDCLSDSVSQCVCLQAAMKQRSAQSLVLYAMDLEARFGDFGIERAREAFLRDDVWQPVRRYLERLAATPDWGEVVFAANVCLEPIVGTLLRRELGTRAAATNGDTVTPVIARAETQEWEWTRAWTVALVRFLLDDPLHGEANRQVMTRWAADWLPRALEAAVALIPLAEQIPGGIDLVRAVAAVRGYAATLLDEAGMGDLAPLIGADPPGAADVDRRRVRPKAERRRGVDPVRPAPGDLVSADGLEAVAPVDGEGATGTYDYVGIVMAKSAEGDAVAGVLGRREGILVAEQPAFWDIRAKDRLVIPYDEVSEQLGYAIDAYSIQHEMSTHYGRMVATDDALMLFSDPTEAMQYLMA